MNSSKFPAVWPNSHPHHDKIALGEITESAADSIYNIITTTHYDKFEPKTVTYEIIMKGVEKLNLTIDFEGSQNNALYPADEFKKSSRGMKINAIIRPFRRVYLGYLQIIDPYKSSRTTSKFSPKFEDADPRDVEATLTEFRQNLETEIQLINNHHINLYSLEQDPMSQDSIGALVAANAKFVDFDFMPNDQALYHPISSKRKSFESAEKPWIAQWKRPAQFMSDSSNIRVFQGSISANDIKQGGLGDCWFLSTLAALTEFPNLIKEMFQDDFVQGVSTGPGQKAGVSPVGLYHLRFYKGGLKTILRVDDYFPCEPGPNMPDRYGPLFSKSNGDELWVLLAEKAFAKIHGSYEAIEAGQPHEALMDLTGAPTKFIQIDDFQSGKKNQLWNLMKSYDQEKYLLTSSARSSNYGEGLNTATGLVSNHAYTLLACLEINGVKLCRLRNPWGRTEWKGDWSDNSPLWTPTMKAALKQTIDRLNNEQRPSLGTTQKIASITNYEEICSAENKDDGLFWMSFDDFVRYFDDLSICMVRHPRYTPHPWQVARKAVFFSLDPTNHQVTHRSFRLTVLAPRADFIFGIHQQDKRCQDAKSYIDIGIVVLKASTSAANKYDFVTGKPIALDRENQTEAITLEAGVYFVVPITTGSRLLHDYTVDMENASKETERTVSDGLLDVPITNRSITNTATPDCILFSKYIIQAYVELFEALNANADGFLDKNEIDGLFMRLTSKPSSDTFYPSLLKKFEDPKNHAKGLSVDGFLQFQYFRFQRSQYDENKVAQEMLILGFDRKLRYRAGRSIGVTIHGTTGHADPAIPRKEPLVSEQQQQPLRDQDKSSEKEIRTESVSDDSATKIFKVSSLPYDASLINAAHIALIIALGEVSTHDTLANYKIYELSAGYAGSSIAIENCHKRCNVKIDMSFPEDQCKNVISFRGSLKSHSEIIPPQETRVFQHFVPKDVADPWNSSYSWIREIN